MTSLTIPIIEYGNIFLAVTSFSNFTTTLRRIDGKEFVEVMYCTVGSCVVRFIRRNYSIGHGPYRTTCLR